jgi:hypothetical protein
MLHLMLGFGHAWCVSSRLLIMHSTKLLGQLLCSYEWSLCSTGSILPKSYEAIHYVVAVVFMIQHVSGRSLAGVTGPMQPT